MRQKEHSPTGNVQAMERSGTVLTGQFKNHLIIEFDIYVQLYDNGGRRKQFGTTGGAFTFPSLRLRNQFVS